MLAKAFWALIAATAALVVLTALGWAVLPALAVLIIIDILAIEAMRRADMKLVKNELAHTISARFDSLEKLCADIAAAVTASRDEILHALGKETPETAEAAVEPTETAEAVAEPTETAEAVIEPADIDEEPKTEPAAGFTVKYDQG